MKFLLQLWNNLISVKQAIKNLLKKTQTHRVLLKLAKDYDKQAFDFYLHRRPNEAEPLFQKALVIRENLLRPNHPDIAKSLSNLASVYINQNCYHEAEPLFLKALNILEHEIGSDHPDTVPVMNYLVLVYMDQRRYEEAVLLLQKVLTINENVLGLKHSNTLTSLYRLAFLYRIQGKYDEAEPLLLKALDIAKHELWLEVSDKVIKLTEELAENQMNNGHYAEAEALFRKVLSIKTNSFGSSYPDTSICISKLAMVYMNQSRYEEAEVNLQKALAINENIFGPEHSNTLTSLNRLSLLYIKQGIFSEAESLLLKAFDIAKHALCPEHSDTVFYLINLAMWYKDKGNNKEAETLLIRALSIWEHLFDYGYTDTTSGFDIYVALNRYDHAFSLYAGAISIGIKNMGLHFATSNSFERRDSIDNLQCSLFTLYSLSFKLTKIDSLLILQLLDAVLQSKQLLTLTQASKHQAIVSGRYPDMETVINERRSLDIQIIQKTLQGLGENETHEQYREILKGWQHQLSELELTLARNIPEIRLEHLRGKATAETVAAALPPGSALVEYVKFRRYEFQAVKAKGEEPWQEWRYLALVLPQGQPDAVRLVDLGEAAEIDHDIEAYLQGMESLPPSVSGNTSFHSDRMVPEDEMEDDVPATPNLFETGIRLRQRLLDCLCADDSCSLAGNRGKPLLVIAADGELSRLPFEALPLDTTGDYLLDQYTIRYVGSGRDLITLPEENRRRPGQPLILADPDFDWQGSDHVDVNPNSQETEPEFPESSIISGLKQTITSSWHQSRDLDNNHLRFSRLPGSRIEAELIGGYLNVAPWLDKEALEGKLKQQPSPAILHIASHGFFYPNQPMETEDWPMLRDETTSFRRHLSKLENPLLRSGLALAGAHHALKAKEHADPDTEDGLLTAADVAEMDLLDTELVVLSACQTGLGDIEIGQGVMGLRTAFQVAGAKTLVMSLWPVDDLATCILMERFYANLIERRQPRGKALTEAKHYLRFLTIREMRTTWLTPDMKARFAEADPIYAAHFDRLNNLPDDAQPFLKPYYWAAFILVGETGALPEGLLQ